MRVHKNLFGTDGEDKIDASEIAGRDGKTLAETLSKFEIIQSGYGKSSIQDVRLENASLYLLITGTMHTANTSMHIISSSNSQALITTIVDAREVSPVLNGMNLTVNTGYTVVYCLIKLH